MGANAGSIKGAIAGYVASRATKAVARAILNFRGSGSGDSQRVVRVYGKGKYWDSLTSSKTDRSLIKLKQMSRNKEEVRRDGKYYYQFDPAHKNQKIHLHKYKHQGGNKYKLIEEVDPETGNTIHFKNGDVETWG